MFAILINEENLPKIQEHQNALNSNLAHFYPKVYLDSKVDWYYIRGYISDAGAEYNWSAYPEELLLRVFQADIDKIKTDWDQIVQN